MDASSLLSRVASALHKVKLEVVMVGNAAAALHGSPVTTIDIDFVFRDTPQNLRKLKALADIFKASIMRPYYPASALYRLSTANFELQLDFMPRIEGVRSFAGLRSRATKVSFGKHSLLVADLSDIIKSKRNRLTAAAKSTLHERELRDMIRRLLALPMNKRTHFLRVRTNSGGSHL